MEAFELLGRPSEALEVPGQLPEFPDPKAADLKQVS